MFVVVAAAAALAVVFLVYFFPLDYIKGKEKKPWKILHKCILWK